MPITSLPPELILDIAEYLEPASCFNFALSTKEQWNLCFPIIQEHSKKFSEWEIIDPVDSGTTIWATLKEILNDPRKGWYVRELTLPADRNIFYDPNYRIRSPDRSLKPPEADQALFMEAARKLENLYPVVESEAPHESTDIIKTLKNEISIGHNEPIIVLLIHHLPFLRTFRFIETWRSGCLDSFMRRLALAYKDPKLASRLPFQRLETVAIGYDFHVDCSKATWLRYFSCIPSVREFAAWVMGDCIERALPSEHVLKSNIKELYLFRSQFDVEALDEILGGIQALERFIYDGAGVDLSGGTFYEPKNVIAALSRHTGPSLEYLALDHDALDDEMEIDGDAPRVSLRSFQKLRTLKCNWKMLLPGDDDEDTNNEALEEGFHREESPEDFNVKSILPESLEELHLYGTFEDSEWEQLTKDLQTPSTATPNLKKLCVTRKAKQYPFGVEDTFATGHNPPPPGLFNAYAYPQFQLFDGHGFQG